MLRTTDFFHHFGAILLLILLISWAHLVQSSENLDESSSSVEQRAKNYTSLAIKEGFKYYYSIKDIVQIGISDVSTYLDLVKRSDVFLDTSLFIEEVLKNYTSASTLLACPNKWGKTINLDMLKTFLEIQVDQNGQRSSRDNTTTFRLFRRSEIVQNETFIHKLQSPLLISKKIVLVDQHQGKYPVVYFSLKEATGDDLVSIRQRVREALARTFQQHSYLVQELVKGNSQDLGLFKEILDGNAKDENIPDGLNLLCRILESYFNKKVVVLIDDYDAFIHHLIQSNKHTSEELNEIINLMVEIVTFALRKNLHMEFGIATGILQISAFEWQFHNYTVYVNDRNKPISEYFGFTRSEVQQFFDMYRFPEYYVWRAHNWYRGYSTEEPSKFFYNPYSITKFFQDRSLNVYRDEGKNESFIQNILRGNHTIRNTMLQLLSRSVLPAENRYPYMIADLDGIRLHGSHLITYLSDKGYLSKISNNPLFNQTPDNKLIMDSVSIPNIEITHQIANWMKTYCKQEYNLDSRTFNWVGVRLRNFIENQTEGIQDMEKLLENVYRNSTNLKGKINLSDEYMFSSQEHPVHLIFDCLCLRAQQETYYEYEFYYKKLLKADIVAINRLKKQAAIIQLKFRQETPDRALAHADNYQHVIDDHANEVETVHLIGISVSSNFTVRIANKVVARNKTIAG